LLQSSTSQLCDLRKRIFARGVSLPFAIRLRDAAGGAVLVGEGVPRLEVVIRTPDAAAALRSFDELRIAEAYMRGDLDVHGDLVGAMQLRALMRDGRSLLKARSVIRPTLRRRRRENPSAVAKHYDSGNVQLLAIDADYQTYTPGIYLSDDEPLEPAAERKLEAAYLALELAPGSSLLDIGCGWGGFLRYCAAREVQATGITLSRHQLGYAKRALATDRLQAQILYADFFSYQPTRRFDAISVMGALEDCSDYRFALCRMGEWLAPGGRVYLDFAATADRLRASSFINKHVWPGAFRMVHLPEFLAAVDRSRLELILLHNDRHNYYLWAKKVYNRWVERHDEVVMAVDERTFRTMHILFAGTCFIMSPHSARGTAYRVLLRRRSTGTQLGKLLPGS
jgi:cyclopropane-fatty-acyl-phospholipid synthase